MQSAGALIPAQRKISTKLPLNLDFAYKKCEHFSLQVIITHT